MQTADYIRREIAAMRRHIAGIAHGLTRETLIAPAPGAANAIGATRLHMLVGEDRLIQTILQGQRALWDADAWALRIGVAAAPKRGEDWDTISLERLDPAALNAYDDAVAAATARYLATLADAALDAAVDFFGTAQSRADTLGTLIIHNISHAGEIAALKGLHGQRGRPT